MENSNTDQEVEITQQESTQDAAVLVKAVQNQKALYPYQPMSQAPFRMGTLVPKNMEYEVKKSLATIIREYKDIDQYVRNKLKYTTTKQLWNVLAAEQVDAVALYLHQFDKEQGIIIADQAGIGKGRQAAAVIRHAVLNGYLPVFCTKSPDLFTDMYRDLKEIDFKDIISYSLWIFQKNL